MILGQAYSRFILDLDGVIWAAGEPIPGAPETVRALRDAGKSLCFVTNNSSRTAVAYAKKLGEIGAGGDAGEVLTSADAVARLLERTVPALRGRAALVVGGDGLLDAVASVGVRIVDFQDAADASLVVVGWDRKLTYEKLRVAALAIRRGAQFVASNTDATYPAPDGFWPGAGAIVAALRTATGIAPVVAGKPEPDILELARERLAGSPALVVGDRIETDVLAAQAVGWPSAVVLTGATGVPELATAPAWPDYLIRTLPDLLQDQPHPRIRPAAGPDLPAVASLLHGGGLQAGAVRERVGRTTVAEAARRVLATAAWQPAGGEAVFIRSVAVDEAVRRRGLGIAVTAAALRAARETGAREFYVVTEAAEGFFARCGFEGVARHDLPADIRGHPQLTRECPSSAPVMRLRLPTPLR